MKKVKIKALTSLAILCIQTHVYVCVCVYFIRKIGLTCTAVKPAYAL